MKKGLGKGLGALLTIDENEEKGIQEIKINDIEPNSQQPRKDFNHEKLQSLAESIKQHGIVQPIIVRQENDIYKIVAGERRWRAARIAGLNTIPAVIREYSKKQVMEIALIENIQREDLNSIEEAEAYDKLINEYNLTQEEISVTIGKSRSAIANSLRLLKLNEKIKELVINDSISSGHARALLVLDDEENQIMAAEEIMDKGLNVRDTEKLVKIMAKMKEIKGKENDSKLKNINRVNAEITDLEEQIKNLLGTKVKLQSGKNSGKIIIEYFSNDELDRILLLFKSIKSHSEMKGAV